MNIQSTLLFQRLPYPFKFGNSGDGYGLRGVTTVLCTICHTIVVLLCPPTHHREAQIRATLALKSVMDNDPWIVLEMPNHLTIFYPEQADYQWQSFWQYCWNNHACSKIHPKIQLGFSIDD